MCAPGCLVRLSLAASVLLAATADEELSLLQTRVNVSSQRRQEQDPYSYDLGYGDGFAAGVQQGTQSGYSAGYSAGVNDASAQAAASQAAATQAGYNSGYGDASAAQAAAAQTSYEAGYRDGSAGQAAAAQSSYDRGYREASANASQGMQQAYDSGYSQGNQSYDIGFSAGYVQGYQRGFSNGSARAYAPLQSVVVSLTEPLHQAHLGATELLAQTTVGVENLERLAARVANESEAPLLVNASATLLGAVLAEWNLTYDLFKICAYNMTIALSTHRQNSSAALNAAWTIALSSIRNFSDTIAAAELALGGASAHIIEANSALDEGAQLLGPKRVFSTDFKKMVKSIHASVSDARDAVRAAVTKFDRSLEALGPGLPHEPAQELRIALRDVVIDLRNTTVVVLSSEQQRSLTEFSSQWPSMAVETWTGLRDSATVLVRGLEAVRAKVETLYPQNSRAAAIGWKMAATVAVVGMAAVLP